MEHTAPHHNPVVERAIVLLDMGKIDAARKMLQEALTQEPDNDEIEALLGNALAQLGQFKPAEFHIQNALRREPGNPFYHLFYSNILSETNRDQEAEREILNAIHIYPLEADFHTTYAWLLYRDGQIEKAESIARNALQLEPENESALALLGAKNSENFDLETARETYWRSLVHNPESSHAHAGLSQTYLLENKTDTALEEAREAIRLDPDDPFMQELYLKAVKAKHPLYSLFWRWSLLCTRLGRTGSLLMVFGLWLAVNVIMRIAENNAEWLTQHPTVSYLLYGFMILYILFCIYTWVANPIFTFLAKRGYLK